MYDYGYELKSGKIWSVSKERYVDYVRLAGGNLTPKMIKNIAPEDMKMLPGYEGMYSVTRDGRVWSHYNGKFLTPNAVKGYQNVCLSKKGKTKFISIHRLVAIAYLGLPWMARDLEVDHKDYNRAHNDVKNLQVLTIKQHRAKDRHRFVAAGQKNTARLQSPEYREYLSKLRMDKKMYRFEHPEYGQFTTTRRELCRRYDLGSGNVSNLVHGNRNTVKGWSLANA